MTLPSFLLQSGEGLLYETPTEVLEHCCIELFESLRGETLFTEITFARLFLVFESCETKLGKVAFVMMTKRTNVRIGGLFCEKKIVRYPSP